MAVPARCPWRFAMSRTAAHGGEADGDQDAGGDPGGVAGDVGGEAGADGEQDEPGSSLARPVFLAELGLAGRLRPVRGILPAVQAAATAGWRTRAMLDRYGADMADQRAFDAKRKMGDLY